MWCGSHTRIWAPSPRHPLHEQNACESKFVVTRREYMRRIEGCVIAKSRRVADSEFDRFLTLPATELRVQHLERDGRW